MVSSFDAMVFARLKHKNQKRKYRGNAYIEHLAEVAGTMTTVIGNYSKELQEIIIAICWLHDVMEDQDVKYTELRMKYEVEVAEGVTDLTDWEKGTRAERKVAARLRLSRAEDYIQSIKCCDLLSNLKEIIECGGKFTEIYIAETKLLLEVMTKADIRLKNMVIEIITDYENNLN